MSNIIMILDDDYKEVLRSLPDFIIAAIVMDTGNLFRTKFERDYSKVSGTRFEEVMERLKRYLSVEKPELLKNFMSITNRNSCRDAPCISCAENLPCEMCGKAIPFDIFDIGGARNKFALSCNPRAHVCLACKVKYGGGLKKRKRRKNVVIYN